MTQKRRENMTNIRKVKGKEIGTRIEDQKREDIEVGQESTIEKTLGNKGIKAIDIGMTNIMMIEEVKTTIIVGMITRERGLSQSHLPILRHYCPNERIKY
jgi:hypothetical protein